MQDTRVMVNCVHEQAWDDAEDPGCSGGPSSDSGRPARRRRASARKGMSGSASILCAPDRTGHCGGAAWLILLSVALSACAEAPSSLVPVLSSSPLASSSDEKESEQVAAAVTALAGSVAPADQGRLRRYLGSREFLLRLNAAEDYTQLRGDQLRIARVIQALATNSAPAAVETFGFLARDPEFLAAESRQELLLRAATRLRPATAAVAEFLDEQSRSHAAHLHLAIEIMVANGSEPAIAVLERKLASKEHEPEIVRGWMRGPILRHRQDVPLLKACERLLKGTELPAELKQSLVEALFDYRPERWYRLDRERPRPPKRGAASPEARILLRRIGVWVAQQKELREGLRAKVSAELAVFD
jgi:hypothetical protein